MTVVSSTAERKTRRSTGACLAALRRTRSGEFRLSQAIDIKELAEGNEAAPAALIPLDGLLTTFPFVTLTDEAMVRVSHGQEVAGTAVGEWVRLMDGQGHLVAVARPGSRPDTLHPAVVLTYN